MPIDSDNYPAFKELMLKSGYTVPLCLEDEVRRYLLEQIASEMASKVSTDCRMITARTPEWYARMMLKVATTKDYMELIRIGSKWFWEDEEDVAAVMHQIISQSISH